MQSSLRSDDLLSTNTEIGQLFQFFIDILLLFLSIGASPLQTLLGNFTGLGSPLQGPPLRGHLQEQLQGPTKFRLYGGSLDQP